MALEVADRGYVLQTGPVVLADNAETCATTRTSRAYLGIASRSP